MGLKPGDSHPSEEAAARAALRDVYDITMSKNPAYGRECGGNIYEKDRKQYLYTNPKPGAINSNDIVIRDETHDKGSRVADYHSHPVGTESRPSDLIDRYGNRIGDISKAIKTGFPQYNVGPDGRMWRANPCGSVDYLGNTNDETY